jgi:hypothetical protein
MLEGKMHISDSTELPHNLRYDDAGGDWKSPYTSHALLERPESSAALEIPWKGVPNVHVLSVERGRGGAKKERTKERRKEGAHEECTEDFRKKDRKMKQ